MGKKTNKWFVGFLILLCVLYFGQAIKTQKILQIQLEDQIKERKLKAPEFNQKLQQISLFNILINPSVVFNTD